MANTSWWQKRSPGYSCDNCGYFDFGADRVCEQCGCKMLGFYYKGLIQNVRTGEVKLNEYHPFDEGEEL